MARIQSSVGLITGIPIQDVVNQLIQVAAQPRELLVSRNKDLQAQQTAVADLLAKTLALQFSADRLGKTSVFNKTTATSSNSNLLSVTVTGEPSVGEHLLTPVRTAQSHQLLSNGFAATNQAIGAGTLTFRFGRVVDEAIALAELNAGGGVERGKIRITDRSGASAEVDLRFAQNIDDVITGINAADAINVTATVSGDRILLSDNTGQTTSNLKVQEVGGGQTAADLGLANINVAADSALGGDLLSLHNETALAAINDGAGLSISDALADLDVSLRDGTSLSIDFHRLARDTDFAHATTSAAGGLNSRVTITAKAKGVSGDGVTILFVDDAGVTQGNETVVYDDSDPDNKTLTVHIDAGQTTATDVANAINNDPTASALFTAAAEGTGGGLIDVNDTAITLGGAAQDARSEATLGEILKTINEADPSRLKAEIAPDGDRILLTDLSADAGGTFAVSDPLNGKTAEKLGLTGTSAGGVITGKRLLGGLKTSLLSSLAGGKGLTLGLLDLTDRSGASATVDLSSADTLEDVVTAINAAGIGIEARVNDARNGLVLTDDSGGLGNLTVANGDVTTTTAEKLKLVVNGAVSSVNSGSLKLQVVSRQTTLASLNGGKGVAKGTFVLFNSNGLAKSINLSSSNVETIGDLIDVINNAGIGVSARINDAGDGIALIDTLGGSQSLRVTDVGSGTTARDLHLLGTAVDSTEDNQPAQVLDGSQTVRIEIDSDDTLQDLVTKVNAAKGGVKASIFSGGSGANPHRLSLLSEVAGAAGRVVVDGLGAGLQFSQTAAARDALVVFGSNDVGQGVLVSSSSNRFTNLIDGLSLTVKASSSEAVTISVVSTDSDVVSSVKTFVEQYNTLARKLGEYTVYNEVDNKKGVLFGSNEALRVESELATLASGRIFGAGSIQSLAEVGINVKSDGTLELDEAKLQAKYAADPQAVEQFFTDEDFGVSARFHRLIETMAGADSSLLVERSAALQRKVEVNLDRIDAWTRRLTIQRDRLLKQFYDMEAAIGKMQNNLNAISQIQALPPLNLQQQSKS